MQCTAACRQRTNNQSRHHRTNLKRSAGIVAAIQSCTSSATRLHIERHNYSARHLPSLPSLAPETDGKISVIRLDRPTKCSSGITVRSIIAYSSNTLTLKIQHIAGLRLLPQRWSTRIGRDQASGPAIKLEPWAQSTLQVQVNLPSRSDRPGAAADSTRSCPRSNQG